MRRHLWLVGGLLLVAAPAGADEVLEQIDAAVGYYEEGDLQGAISELQFAIEAIRAQTGDLFAATFPDPPAGWSADEVESTAGIPGLSGQVLGREYQGPDGETVRAELMIDNPMMQAFAMLLQNPAMLSTQPDAERVRVHRHNALLTWPEDGTGELTLIVGGRAMLRLDGSGLASKDTLVGMMEGWDVDRLEEVAGL